MASLTSLFSSPHSLTHSLTLTLTLSLSLSLSLLPLGCEYVRTSFNPGAAGLEGLEWDSAELFRVSQNTLGDQVGSHDELGDGFFI